MTSWSDLPTEIKLLIVRSYIDSILSELDEPDIDVPHERRCDKALKFERYQILNLIYALPSLRDDIRRFCDAQEAIYLEEDHKRVMTGSYEGTLTSHYTLVAIRIYWSETAHVLSLRDLDLGHAV